MNQNARWNSEINNIYSIKVVYNPYKYGKKFIQI